MGESTLIELVQKLGWAPVGGILAIAMLRLTPHIGAWLESASQTSKANTVAKLNGTLVEAMKQAMSREVIRAEITKYLEELPDPGRGYFREHMWHNFGNYAPLTRIKQDIERLEKDQRDEITDRREADSELRERIKLVTGKP